MNSVDWKDEVLIDVLARTYEQIILVDSEDGTGQHICGRERTKILDCEHWCGENLAKGYFGDDENIFLQKIRMDSIAESLKYEDDYTIEYSVNEDGDIRRKRLVIFWGREKKVLCMCVDDVTREITEAKREQELIKRSLDAAHKSNEARREFLDSMRQEMREPLCGVGAMLELAMTEESELRDEYIVKARKCLEQYFFMLEQMFTMSDIEKGKLYVRDEVVMVDRLLEKLQFLLAEEMASKKICMETSNKNPRINTFYHDRIHMTQLLWSLLEVIVKGSEDGTKLDLEIGFDVDQELELFDLTISIHGTGKTVLEKSDSLGTGMAFVYRLVDCFSGMIDVSGENSDGIVVEIRMPVQPVEKKAQSEASIISHLVDHIKERDFSKYRALVVDDNEMNRAVTVAFLRKFGLQVETASDGQEAIDMLVASPGRYYQIMFMNPVLPGKTGFETTMELREMKRRDINDITIVALTSNGLRDERIRSLEHGMDYHIVLPIDEVELKEILIRELQDLGPRDEHEIFGFRVLK